MVNVVTPLNQRSFMNGNVTSAVLWTQVICSYQCFVTTVAWSTILVYESVFCVTLYDQTPPINDWNKLKPTIILLYLQSADCSCMYLLGLLRFLFLLSFHYPNINICVLNTNSSHPVVTHSIHVVSSNTSSVKLSITSSPGFSFIHLRQEVDYWIRQIEYRPHFCIEYRPHSCLPL
jgi:hypothetical protein